MVVLACLCRAVGGRGGRVAGRPCWCAGVGVVAPCRGPWSVSLAVSMGRRVAVCWWCHCAVPCGPCAVAVRPCLCPPWSVAGRVRPSLLVCWCAVGGWRPFLAVFRGRGGPFGPSVVLVSVAGPCGPCGPCFGPCRLAGRVGLASGGGGGWRCLRLRWCLPCQRAAARGWLAVGRLRCFPWWWRPLALLVVLAGVAPAAAVGRPSIKGPNTSGRRGGLAGGVGYLLAVASVVTSLRQSDQERRPSVGVPSV